MKHILDSSFQYTPSHATDVSRTFERVRRELEQSARDAASRQPAAPAPVKVVSLRSGKQGA